MSIWKKPVSLEQINLLRGDTLARHLEIEIIEQGDNYLTASMPVNNKTRQPFGVLHGGASIALAETVGSIAANLAVDEKHYCVGMEVNGNHLRAVADNKVIATATALHLGKTTQVWDIRIVDEQERNVCISRLTMAVLKKR